MAAEVYLYTGPENGEKNDAINSLRENARKKNGDLDEYKYYASDTRLQDVISQLQNVSLFSSALFVVLKNAELIKLKPEIELLASYINGASDSPNTLILVSDENSVEKKLENLIPADHKKIFWEMFENRKNQWVRDYFRKNGLSIEDEAVEQILDMVENNTETLRSECSRFFYVFAKGYCVTVSDVDKILSHNREENAFTLFEAMADNTHSPKQRFEDSLEILQKIRLSRDSNGVALIAGLTYCFRQLRAWHALCAKNKTPSDSEMRSAGFASKKNQARYKNAASVWGPGATASVLSLLAATDMETRTGGMALEDTRLTMMIYSIVIKNGVYCSEYQFD